MSFICLFSFNQNLAHRVKCVPPSQSQDEQDQTYSKSECANTALYKYIYAQEKQVISHPTHTMYSRMVNKINVLQENEILPFTNSK